MPWRHPLTERPESTQMAPAQATTNHRLHVVSHTHWDREWYLSLESFRLRLVAPGEHLVDLSKPTRLSLFHLDGQMIPLDDYLEVRPASGSVSPTLSRRKPPLGPWYVLNDEFLASGESTVRSLLIGRMACASTAPVMKVGYLPDQFGNISQAPQILRGFGIDNASSGAACTWTKTAGWSSLELATVRGCSHRSWGSGTTMPSACRAIRRGAWRCAAS